MFATDELLTTLHAADEAHAALTRYVATIELQPPSLLHSSLVSLEMSRDMLQALADERAIPASNPIPVGRPQTKDRDRDYGNQAEVALTGVTLQIVEEIIDVLSESQPQGDPVAPDPT